MFAYSHDSSDYMVQKATEIVWHIYASANIIGSDNGLSHVLPKVISQANAN